MFYDTVLVCRLEHADLLTWLQLVTYLDQHALTEQVENNDTTLDSDGSRADV